MSENRDWMIRLSAALGLAEAAQDWGIENSDPARLAEFIHYFESHTAQDPWDFEALAELIICSANDALLGGVLHRQDHDLLSAFLRTHSDKFPQTLRYWLGLSTANNHPEFPVVQVLNSVETG